jgi:hypothetical protein
VSRNHTKFLNLFFNGIRKTVSKCRIDHPDSQLGLWISNPRIRILICANICWIRNIVVYCRHLPTVHRSTVPVHIFRRNWRGMVIDAKPYLFAYFVAGDISYIPVYLVTTVHKELVGKRFRR